jgi:YidC/Oxa1 family membrane protein insertase
VNIFVEWMTQLLKWLFELTNIVGLGSYGLAIILLTIIIKSLIYPLTWKQMRSMSKTMEIQPKVQELQKKYKNNPEKLNAEMIELYKTHNVNPAGGCLPILIQLPIFWTLYRTLFSFSNYIADPSQAYFLWFDLTQREPYYILAVIAALTTFLQTKVSTATNPTAKNTNGAPDPTATTQKTMLYIMPFFMGYISATVPAGLALYFVTMNIVSILQQIYINRKLAKEKVEAAA